MEENYLSQTFDEHPILNTEPAVNLGSSVQGGDYAFSGDICFSDRNADTLTLEGEATDGVDTYIIGMVND